MKSNKLKQKTTGFTLIETLVAIFILSSAVAGPMVLSIKNISSASVSRDQLVAFYLGQEVLEYIRNVRDTNLINSNYWLEGLDECRTDSQPSGCYIDVLKDVTDVDAIKSCDPGGCPKIKFNGQNYSYTSGDDSNFTRTVKMVGIGSDEAEVNVSVSWTSRYGDRTMKLQDNIFNWR